MEFLVPYLSDVFNGFLLTVAFTVIGVFAGLVLGILLAIGDMYGGKIASMLIRFYVEFFRGSPIIVQLFIFYFTIPTMLSIFIDPFLAGLMVFCLNSAAYQKGYIKGAMEAVFEDQMTAALSIGLSKWQAIFYVILPQSLRLVIPSWSNEFASLTKSTSALLVIGVKDLTSMGKTIAGLSYRYLETYLLIALIYLIWITVVLKISDMVYERVKIPGIEISA